MSVEVKVNGEWRKVAGGTLYADAPVGTISAYGGETAPSGWLLCQGQAVSRTTYAELFKAIGTSFGTGDGSTTFNLPDLRETVPVGSGTRGSGVTAHDTYSVGTFKDDQLQDHQHYHYSGRRNGWDIYAANSGESTYGMLSTSSTVHDNGSYIGEVYNGRRGTTTHGKQLGVNYIIKAVQSAVPADIVAGVDEQIAPLTTVTSGTGTRNTSYVSSASFAAEWYKVGRVCTVNLQFNLSAATTSNEELITGLPKPITEIACVGEGSSNTTVSDFVIKKNGAVRTHYTAPEGQFMHGTATYITAE